MNRPIAIYKGGSSLFLENHNDIDFIYVYETNKERLNGVRQCQKTPTKDIHCATLDKMQNQLFLGAYSLPYLVLVSGEDLMLNNHRIFERQKEYANLLLDYASFLPRESKKWYQVLLGTYCLKNGINKDFTKTQIKNAQKVHDNGINDTLYKYIIDNLSKIVNN